MPINVLHHLLTVPLQGSSLVSDLDPSSDMPLGFTAGPIGAIGAGRSSIGPIGEVLVPCNRVLTRHLLGGSPAQAVGPAPAVPQVPY